jgi:hypothetical protein
MNNKAAITKVSCDVMSEGVGFECRLGQTKLPVNGFASNAGKPKAIGTLGVQKPLHIY